MTPIGRILQETRMDMLQYRVRDIVSITADTAPQHGAEYDFTCSYRRV